MEVETKEPQAIQLPVKPNRKCGSCSACCTTLAVAGLGKPAYTKCAHVKQGTRSCKIYDQRPGECQSYDCGWLQGFGTNAMKPDECGVVITMEMTRLGRTFLLMEVWKGATKHGSVVAECVRVAQTQGLAVITAGPTWRTIVYCPKDKEHELSMALAEYEAQKKANTQGSQVRG